MFPSEVVSKKIHGSEAYIAAPIDVTRQPCLAVHVRRGDACVNKDRKCLDYDKFYRVAELVIRTHPHIQSLLVVTDADDFPLHKFSNTEIQRYLCVRH